MTCYADTSWWLSLGYRDDKHHQTAIRFLDDTPTAQILWTPWQRVEVFNGFRQLARRGRLERGEARQMIRSLETEVRLGYWQHCEFNWTDAIRRACQLSEQLAHTLSITGFDLFHVAIGLTIRAEMFLTFDEEQKVFAETAGLRVN